MFRRSLVIFAASLALLSTLDLATCFAAAAPAQPREDLEMPRFLKKEIKRFIFTNTTTWRGGSPADVSTSDSEALYDALTSSSAQDLGVDATPTSATPTITATPSVTPSDNEHLSSSDVSQSSAARDNDTARKAFSALQASPTTTPVSSAPPPSSSPDNGESVTTQISIVPGRSLDGTTGSTQSSPSSSASHLDRVNGGEVTPQSTYASTVEHPGNGVTSQLGSTAQPETSASPSSAALLGSLENLQQTSDIAHQTSSSIASETFVSIAGGQGSNTLASQTPPSTGRQTDTSVQSDKTQGADTLQSSFSSQGVETASATISIPDLSSLTLATGESINSNSKQTSPSTGRQTDTPVQSDKTRGADTLQSSFSSKGVETTSATISITDLSSLTLATGESTNSNSKQTPPSTGRQTDTPVQSDKIQGADTLQLSFSSKGVEITSATISIMDLSSLTLATEESTNSNSKQTPPSTGRQTDTPVQSDKTQGVDTLQSSFSSKGVEITTTTISITDLSSLTLGAEETIKSSFKNEANSLASAANTATKGAESPPLITTDAVSFTIIPPTGTTISSNTNDVASQTPPSTTQQTNTQVQSENTQNTLYSSFSSKGVETLSTTTKGPKSPLLITTDAVSFTVIPPTRTTINSNTNDVASQTSPSTGQQTDTQVQSENTQNTFYSSFSSKGVETSSAITSFTDLSSLTLGAGETIKSNSKDEAGRLTGAVTTATEGPKSPPLTTTGAVSSTVVPLTGTTINSGVITATAGISPAATSGGVSSAAAPGETVKTSPKNIDNHSPPGGEATSGIPTPNTKADNEGSAIINTNVNDVVSTTLGNGAGAAITHAAQPASSSFARQSVTVPATGTNLGSEPSLVTAGPGTQPTLTPGSGAGPTSQISRLSGPSASIALQPNPTHANSQAGGSPPQTTLADGAVVPNTAQMTGAAKDTASTLETLPASVSSPARDPISTPNLNAGATKAASILNPSLAAAASILNAIPASIENPLATVSGNPPLVLNPALTAAASVLGALPASIQNPSHQVSLAGSLLSASPVVPGGSSSPAGGPQNTAGATGAPVIVGSPIGETASSVEGTKSPIGTASPVGEIPSLVGVTGSPVATGSPTGSPVAGTKPQIEATSSPIGATSSPVGETPSAVGVKGSPVVTGSPVGPTGSTLGVSGGSPIGTTGAPVGENGSPVATASSVGGTGLPVGGNELPVATGSLVGGTGSPIGGTGSPGGETGLPSGTGSPQGSGQPTPGQLSGEKVLPSGDIYQKPQNTAPASAVSGSGPMTASNGEVINGTPAPTPQSATPESGIAGYSTQSNGNVVPISAAIGTGSTVSEGHIVPVATGHEVSAQPPRPNETGEAAASSAVQGASAAAIAAGATQNNAAPPGPTATPVVPPHQQFSGEGPYTQSPVGYDTLTTQVVPTSILHGSSSTPSATQGGTFAPFNLPSNVPHILYQNGGPGSQPPKTRLINIAFRYALNYLFVYNHTISQEQIFHYLPRGICYGLGIEISQITMQSLRAWDTYEDVGYITTLALAWIPEGLVESLGLLVSTSGSTFYHNPDNSTAFLLSMINSAVPITGSNGTDGASTPFGNIPTDTNSTKTAGAPIGGDIGHSEHVRASSVGIGVGVACGAAAYGAAMFFVARRYKKRRKSHLRSPSMFSSPVMSHAGPDAGAGAALMSGAMGGRSGSPYHDNDGRAGSRGSGRSGSSRHQISAPVMAENSLGWN